MNTAQSHLLSRQLEHVCIHTVYYCRIIAHTMIHDTCRIHARKKELANYGELTLLCGVCPGNAEMTEMATKAVNSGKYWEQDTADFKCETHELTS